jgi:D-tyrosyl-tRNA(Tyr) deacylase
VAQRVSESRVCVDGEIVGETGPGLLALVGVATGDGENDALALAEKLLHLRIFPDDEGKMNRSLLDTGGMLGVVSQFTLLGDCRRGRRPSYGRASEPEEAERLIVVLVERARALGTEVATGRFGARMSVELVNEGPVTLLVDTRREF